MLYNHRLSGRSGVPASAGTELSFVRDPIRRAVWRPVSRGLSLWGLGAALGLLSFPLRARSDEPDPELAGELCPADPLLEACDSATASPSAAAAREPDPALLAVLGGDVRLDGLPVLPDLPALSESPADLVLSQVPGGAGASGPLGLSWPALALAGGGGLVAVAVLASGGSDSDDSGGGNDGGTTPDTMPGPMPVPGGTDSNSDPVVTTDAPTATLTAMEGEAAMWTVSDWFSDPDTGDTLTYAVSGNPTWLTLTGEGLAIEAGATDDADIGSYTVVLTATDAGALAATHTLTLAVENTNDAPVVVTEGDSAPRRL